MTLFIGGSRAVSRLNEELRARLDDFIQRGCTIFVGDANGADKAVQQHFSERGYSQVVVYCMDRCRNNVGGWPVKQISRPGGTRDFAYYAVKDKAMAEDAKCGMMLWDGESKGTLNNIQNLIAAGKKTLVYFSPEKAFHKLESIGDLTALMARCDQALMVTAQRQIVKAKPDRQHLFQP